MLLDFVRIVASRNYQMFFSKLSLSAYSLSGNPVPKSVFQTLRKHCGEKIHFFAVSYLNNFFSSSMSVVLKGVKQILHTLFRCESFHKTVGFLVAKQ